MPREGSFTFAQKNFSLLLHSKTLERQTIVSIPQVRLDGVSALGSFLPWSILIHLPTNISTAQCRISHKLFATPNRHRLPKVQEAIPTLRPLIVVSSEWRRSSSIKLTVPDCGAKPRRSGRRSAFIVGSIMAGWLLWTISINREVYLPSIGS